MPAQTFVGYYIFIEAFIDNITFVSNTKPECEHVDSAEFYFHLLLLLPLFSLLLSLSFNQSPRTPNRSASTTDVESHTESDAERGEVTFFALPFASS